jgi:hypothetical protein
MEKKILIGLSGKPKAGKTTAAEILREMGVVNHYEMSDPIIKEINVMLGAIGLGYDSDQKAVYRPLLQWLANLRRSQSERYWIDPMLRTIITPAVIGGVRHSAEVMAIQEAGGVVWRIVRNEADNRDPNPAETQLDTRTDLFDAIVENNASVDELAMRMRALLDQLKDSN